MNSLVVRLTENNLDDFWAVHSEANGMAECYCVFWWLQITDSWDLRTAAENKILRSELFKKGIYDGYLLYVDGQPAGWCQAVQRDKLVKLAQRFELPPAPDTWAISCFFIAKKYRRQKMAAFLLQEVIKDLKSRKVEKLEAYPRHGHFTDDNELWTGPEQMYLAAGFEYLKPDPSRPVMLLRL